MSVELFNYTNQKLNAERLRELESFNSASFGGIIAESSPFSIDGSQVTLSENTSILGGGVLLNNNASVTHTFMNSSELWCMKVNLDNSDANIVTEINDNIEFITIGCDYISRNASYTYYSPVISAEDEHLDIYYEYILGEDEQHYYELTSDPTVDSSKQYYVKVEANSIRFKANISTFGSRNFTYFGNTLWLNANTFIIPLYAKIDDDLVQTVIVKGLNDFRELLSLDAYSQLKAYCDGTFVWSSGGGELVTAPDGTTHKKGDVGVLNISGDKISHQSGSFVQVDKLIISNLAYADNDEDTKLTINPSGQIGISNNYIQPVEHGGTGSSNKLNAKRNLGIYYGTNNKYSPKDYNPISNPSEGDIFLWIIE